MHVALLHTEFGLVDDLTNALEAAGHQVRRYVDASALIHHAESEHFDLFLLEWNPRDARQILRELCLGPGLDSSVIFFNCHNSESELAYILGNGADDYIIGPVGVREVVARATAVMRRRGSGFACRANVLEMPPYRFDISAKLLVMNGAPVTLTEKEFELAVYLFRNLGRTLTRGRLLEAVWGSSLLAVSRTVDTHISRIRRKLCLRPETGFRLSAVYGNGYRLERMVADGSLGLMATVSDSACPGGAVSIRLGRVSSTARAS